MKSKSKTSCWLRGFFSYILYLFPCSVFLLQSCCHFAYWPSRWWKKKREKNRKLSIEPASKCVVSECRWWQNQKQTQKQNQTQNLRTRPEQQTQWAPNGLTSELKYRNYKQPTTCPIWWQHINIYYKGMWIDKGNDQLAYILYMCKKKSF